MAKSIIEISHEFFEEVLAPILQHKFPVETAQIAFGVFGYGSEVLQLDDDYSSDHHWGLRVDALIPEALFNACGQEILRTVEADLPDNFQGQSLHTGYSDSKALSPPEPRRFPRSDHWHCPSAADPCRMAGNSRGGCHSRDQRPNLAQ